MSELSELYQQVILDHNKNPRNYRKIEGADQAIEGYNPLCGDHFFIYLKLKDGIIEDIAFEGSGCAISKSSASMMTTVLKGKTQEEAERLFERFHDLVTGHGEASAFEDIGKLAVFAGVRDYPVRVKCASLAWHTMHAALTGSAEAVKTE